MNRKTVDKLRRQLDLAEAAIIELEWKRREAGDAAMSQALEDWDREHGAALEEARTRASEYESSLDAAKVELAKQQSKRVGKTVYRARYSRCHTRLIGCAVGIIEIVTPTTETGGAYRPSPGTEVVRILKKDGTPGKRIDTSINWWVDTKPEME